MPRNEHNIIKVAIVGLPNTGKSQIFNNLTKTYTMVSNYPMTTIETKSQLCEIDGQQCEIVDTPGFHCLYIHSEEELVIRNFLYKERPDVLIQCVDTNLLKQSLTLTADLMELEIPMVISLNAIDETRRKGISVDASKLSELLGVPVVECIAVDNVGTTELKRAIFSAAASTPPVKYAQVIEEGLQRIREHLPANLPFKRKSAVLLFQDDPFFFDQLIRAHDRTVTETIRKEINGTQKQFRGNISIFITHRRKQWVSKIIPQVVKHPKISLEGFSQTVAKISRHPIYGIPILGLIMLTMFFAVVNLANAIAGWMHDVFWYPVESFINNLVPLGFWNDFLIGDYGILTFGLSNAILTVVPILTVFFLIFNTLEDIGYLPNLAVLTKRISEKIGLSGNAILPITLGFGCKTMATLTTRSLKSQRERYIAIYLIAFALPCASQMALNMSILGRVGFYAFLIAYSTLFLVEIIAGFLLNKILKREPREDFIQMLPNMRMPNLKAVVKKTGYKLASFLREALPIFILAAAVLFFIDKLGILGATKNFLAPIITDFLGFPLEMVDVLILCMARHEAAAAMMIKLAQQGLLSPVQSIVAVALTTMFVPCFANMAAMIKELGFRTAIFMILMINATSLGIAGLLNWLLRAIMG